MITVGIDLSKLKFDAAVLCDGKTKDRVFANNIDGFEKFVAWLAPHPLNDLHICMEGTGRFWEPLAEYLVARGFAVSVVNPLQIKGFADSELRRSKTDRIDARIISRFCKALVPAVWTPPSPQIKKMRDYQRHLDSLIEDRTRQINRFKSGELDDCVKESIGRNLKHLGSEIEWFEKQIELMIKDSEELSPARKIMTIIGVGQATAAKVIGELGSIDRFQRTREAEIFCGLAPRQYESGSSVRGKSKLSKRCNTRIRAALFMASLSGMRHNPQLRTFAERLRSKNKLGKVIVCAVARKLLRMIFAILRSGNDYDPTYCSMAT